MPWNIWKKKSSNTSANRCWGLHMYGPFEDNILNFVPHAIYGFSTPYVMIVYSLWNVFTRYTAQIKNNLTIDQICRMDMCQESTELCQVSTFNKRKIATSYCDNDNKIYNKLDWFEAKRSFYYHNIDCHKEDSITSEKQVGNLDKKPWFNILFFAISIRLRRLSCLTRLNFLQQTKYCMWYTTNNIPDMFAVVNL